MRTDKLSSKTQKMIMSEGIWETLKHAVNYLRCLYHEWYFGISTFEYIDRSELGIDNPDSYDSTPTDYVSLRKVLKHIKIEKNKDVFLDYGSGTGRVLIVAATLPFHKVIGVEISPKANKIASDNIERAKKRLKCKDIEIVEADGASYRVPMEVTIIYFYNPFGESTLAATLDNIEASLVLRHRKVTIIYKGPYLFEKQASRRKWLIKRAEFTRLTAHKYVIYETQTEPSSLK